MRGGVVPSVNATGADYKTDGRARRQPGDASMWPAMSLEGEEARSDDSPCEHVDGRVPGAWCRDFPPFDPSHDGPTSSDAWAKVGSGWTVDGGTVTASGMMAEERYAVSPVIVTEGVRHFLYTVNASMYPDGHMFVGAAAANGASADGESDCATWGFSPCTCHLFVGTRLNEHGAEVWGTRGAPHFLDDPEADLVGKVVGARVLMRVDMGAKALAFSVNGEPFVDCAVELPAEGVRPWAFLYHEGDSITLVEVAGSGGGDDVSRPSTAGTDSGVC